MNMLLWVMPKWLKKFFIPEGMYCYTWRQIPSAGNGYRGSVKNCPFRVLVKGKPTQMNGYCHYLKCGDWEDGIADLLWDGVKECGIKEKDSDDQIGF